MTPTAASVATSPRTADDAHPGVPIARTRSRARTGAGMPPAKGSI
jgi:hypothetical protein